MSPATKTSNEDSKNEQPQSLTKHNDPSITVSAKITFYIGSSIICGHDSALPSRLPCRLRCDHAIQQNHLVTGLVELVSPLDCVVLA